jgi:hypothetical protein
MKQACNSFPVVMAGHSSLPGADYVHLSALPAIHDFSAAWKKDVDARDKPGTTE